jgi:hypothetical protein
MDLARAKGCAAAASPLVTSLSGDGTRSTAGAGPTSVRRGGAHVISAATLASVARRAAAAARLDAKAKEYLAASVREGSLARLAMQQMAIEFGREMGGSATATTTAGSTGRQHTQHRQGTGSTGSTGRAGSTGSTASTATAGSRSQTRTSVACAAGLEVDELSAGPPMSQFTKWSLEGLVGEGLMEVDGLEVDELMAMGLMELW